jgi:hypothetical protein
MQSGLPVSAPAHLTPVFGGPGGSIWTISAFSVTVPETGIVFNVWFNARGGLGAGWLVADSHLAREGLVGLFNAHHPMSPCYGMSLSDLPLIIHRLGI